MLVTGKLILSTKYLGTKLCNEKGYAYKVFRNISKVNNSISPAPQPCVFTVSFKFKHLSHKANKIASIIPMLLISGFPGFSQKLYAVNNNNGFWMGIYEWESKQHLEAYKNSFVLRMMKKRAIPTSISMLEKENFNVNDFIQQCQK